MAMIRGLGAGNTMVMFASGRSITRTSFRNGFNNIGVRGLMRTTTRRAIGNSTSSSATKATIQQRTREAFSRSKQAPLRILQQIRSRLLHTTRARRSQVNPNPNPTPSLGSPNENLSLGQRMRKLSREYGWSALGVYLALSAVDFPFCYLLVRYLGTDRIGKTSSGSFCRSASFLKVASLDKRRGLVQY
jgi:N-terminal acetyltransferase 2